MIASAVVLDSASWILLMCSGAIERKRVALRKGTGVIHSADAISCTTSGKRSNFSKSLNSW